MLHMSKILCLIVSAMLMFAASPAIAKQQQTIKREILAIYDGAVESSVRVTVLHKAAELPLNHLGFVLHYHDIRKPLPTPADVEKSYTAVITWLVAEPSEPRVFLRWAATVARRGVRLISLGEIAGDDCCRELNLANGMLNPLGLIHTGDYVRASDNVTAIINEPKSYDFESTIGPNVPGLPAIVTNANGRADVLVEIESGPPQHRRRSVVVAVGPGGGYIAPGFAIRYDPHADRVSWLVNPFVFFARALLNDFSRPIPDVTTVAGRRLYFSHVDGDGWNNVAQMQRYREAGTLASEVMAEQLIEAYPDLPVTIGLIAGDILPEHGGSKTSENIARRIFALPQVEIGSHTCTHPFKWGFYENYSRPRELKLIEAVRSEHEGYFSRLARFLHLPGSDDGYIAGSAELPRAYLRNPFDLGIEVDRAVKVAERLAPPGKRLKVYQWSGDTMPFEAAVARTRRLDLTNINGGDSRLDADFPSVIYVAPVGVELGQQRQVYAVNSNENTYTNDWSGPYYGFRNLEETLRRTETPRRLKGFNIYYHTYSAERQASLDAVKAMLDLARASQVTPITTSHYAAIADGFYSSKIQKITEDHWKIENRGALNTIRFDKADHISVDFNRSEGVLGQTRHAGSLYVALDPDVVSPEIAVKENPHVSDTLADRPVLVDSRWPIEALKWNSSCQFSFKAQGFGSGDMTWRVRPGTNYTLLARTGSTILSETTAKSNEAGQLDVSLPSSENQLSIEIACTISERAEKDVHAD